MSINHRNLIIIIIILLLFVSCLACSAPSIPDGTANKAPVIKSVSYARDVMARQDQELICTAEDPDGDELEYKWAVESGELRGSGPMVLWITPDTMGDYILELTVNDNKGGEIIQSLNVRVLTNADGTTTPNVELHLSPAITDTVLVKRTVKIGTKTRISCIVSGAEGSLTYEWSRHGVFLKPDPKLPPLDSGLCNIALFTAPPNVGHYIVSVIARDQRAREMKGQVDFDVFCCPRY